jgi:hypothetical protein
MQDPHSPTTAPNTLALAQILHPSGVAGRDIVNRNELHQVATCIDIANAAGFSQVATCIDIEPMATGDKISGWIPSQTPLLQLGCIRLSRPQRSRPSPSHPSKVELGCKSQIPTNRIPTNNANDPQ